MAEFTFPGEINAELFTIEVMDAMGLDISLILECNSALSVVRVPLDLSAAQIQAIQAILDVHDPTVLTPAQELIEQRRQKREQALADYLTNALKGMTPNEAAQYVEDNVTNLASAKKAMKVMARTIVALATYALEAAT